MQAYNERLLIDQWDDLPADRVAVTITNIQDCSEETSYSDCRFKKEHFRYLMIALGFNQDVLVLDNGSRIPAEKAFLIFLYRMAYPRQLVDMEATRSAGRSSH